METTDFYHAPVFLKECLEFLNINPNGIYVDCTLGGAGHSLEIAKRLTENGTLHAFDRDLDAISFAQKRLGNVSPKIILHPLPYSFLEKEIEENSIDGILYDLGISSHQVDDSKRGFTFVGDTPLDLRMDTRERESAQEWLQKITEEDLAKVLSKNADLERANRLAKQMKTLIHSLERKIIPEDIKQSVLQVFPDKRKDLNSILARIFQAIRMEINQELNEIHESLTGAVTRLKKGGRLVIISYHSVEDREVKTTVSDFLKPCLCSVHQPICTCGGNNQKLKKILRKPLIPSEEEIRKNSRARSAKLRVYERV